jgi:hypothetical protein
MPENKIRIIDRDSIAIGARGSSEDEEEQGEEGEEGEEEADNKQLVILDFKEFVRREQALKAKPCESTSLKPETYCVNEMNEEGDESTWISQIPVEDLETYTTVRHICSVYLSTVYLFMVCVVVFCVQGSCAVGHGGSIRRFRR